MFNSKCTLWSLILVSAGGAITGWSHLRSEAGETVVQPAQPTEEIASTIVHGLGYVEPRSEVRQLGIEATGVIAECQIEAGQAVTEGTVLMRLKAEQERADLEIALAQLELARADRAKVLSGVNPRQIEAAERAVDICSEELRHAEQRRQRIEKLFVRGAATAAERDDLQATCDQAEAKLEQAKAEVENLKQHVTDEDKTVADAKVLLAEQQLAAAEERLAQRELRAPFDGVVLDVLRRQGETVDGEPVVLFGDVSRMRVRAEIDERFAFDLKPQQTVTVSGTNLRGRTFTGRVILVNQLMGPKTVFARTADERKDLDVIEVLVEMEEEFAAPIGLRVDIAVDISAK